MKRGEILIHSIAFALRQVKIHGRKGILTPDQRLEIARGATNYLTLYDDYWKLDEEVPLKPGPSV